MTAAAIFVALSIIRHLRSAFYHRWLILGLAIFGSLADRLILGLAELSRSQLGDHLNDGRPAGHLPPFKRKAPYISIP